jgi:alpha-glucosidase
MTPLSSKSAESAEALQITSPDGRLSVALAIDEGGIPRYAVQLAGHPVLQPSRLGLIREDFDFSQGLRLISASDVEAVEDHYEILTAKRRVNSYRANRRVFNLENAEGRKLDVVFLVSDDGIAFQYRFPEESSEIHRLKEELSSFHFLPETRAWLQPMSVAKTFWAETNPAYEEFYDKDIPVGTPSTLGAGWVYPALFRSGETWLLVSENGMHRGYCATRLRHESPNGEYTVGFPDPREHFQNGAVNPESALPWTTPWRLIVIGDLQTIAESTLGIDLADPARVEVAGPIEPGQASWSWVLLKDDQTTYDVQKRFIDFASEMGWRYCLIDSLWDTQIGFEKIRELIDYGRAKNVGILLWYNSAGDWNSTHQTPRNKMLTRESRLREFALLKEMGVAGLKIDFFPGDGQSAINYYIDILEDSAPYGLLINFHGSTIPRGWHRTYPHLMTMEGIRGLEFMTFEQRNANQAPTHATMLPFTRNVFDPMDFTPMVLDQIPGIRRLTTSAHELALSVLFTSGIQHFGEIPEGMAKTPGYVRGFLRDLPEVWDDIRFLDGHPGEFVVLARRSGDRWFLAGINGKNSERELELDLSRLQLKSGSGNLITDGAGENLSFRQEEVRINGENPITLTLKPRGGFVAILQ